MKTRSGNFYECVVKYDKLTEHGALKKVSETYCVEAESFADAERHVEDNTVMYSEGEYEIANITPAKYKEIFFGDNEDEDELYFKAKLEFLTLDENTGKEKKTTVYYLVTAKDFAASLNVVQKAMGGAAVNYTTAQITESKIIELFLKDED